MGVSAILHGSVGDGQVDIGCLLYVAFLFNSSLQCFDTVGWATGRASGL